MVHIVVKMVTNIASVIIPSHCARRTFSMRCSNFAGKLLDSEQILDTLAVSFPEPYINFQLIPLARVFPTCIVHVYV